MFDEVSQALTVVRWFMGVLFLYSAIAKALSMQSFVRTVRRVLPASSHIEGLVAPMVVVIELVTGLFLLVGSVWAKLAAIALLSLFAAVAYVMVKTDQRVSCNCFGIDSSEYLSRTTVIRNLVLALMMAATVWVPDAELSVMTLLYAVIAFTLFMTLTRMVSNHREFLALLKETDA